MASLSVNRESLKKSRGLHLHSTTNHLCSFYSNETEYLESLKAFTAYGKSLNAKMIYIGCPTQHPILQTCLSEVMAILDLSLKENQCIISPFSDFYLVPENLNEEKIIEKIKLENSESQQSGYDHLFIATDMSWVFDPSCHLQAAAIYEKIMDQLACSKELHCKTLCQYNTQIFPSHLLNQVMGSRPPCDLDDKVGEKDFYASPRESLKKDNDTPFFHQQWESFLDHHNSKEEPKGFYEPSEEMFEFCYQFTHDLKSHIRSAHFFNFLILQEHADTISPQVSEFLQKTSQALHKAFYQIDSLNLMLKPTKSKENWVLIDLNEIINETIESFKTSMETLAGQIHYHSCPQKPILGDISQISRIFKYIFDNCLKFHSPKIPLKIVVTSELVLNNTIKITIKDNGQGLDTCSKKNICQSYYRSNPKKDSDCSMELHICQKIIERHNGTLNAYSEKGIGTTVTLIFPITPDSGRDD